MSYYIYFGIHDCFFYNFPNTVRRRITRRRRIEIEDVLKVTLNENYIKFFLFLFVSSIFFLFILSMASADWLTAWLTDCLPMILNGSIYTPQIIIYFFFFSKMTQSRWVRKIYNMCRNPKTKANGLCVRSNRT